MRWSFKRKIKLEVTDVEAARQDFIRNKRNSPPSTQECYKLYLRYHRPGDPLFHSNRIYFFYKGKFQSIPRG